MFEDSQNAFLDSFEIGSSEKIVQREILHELVIAMDYQNGQKARDNKHGSKQLKGEED